MLRAIVTGCLLVAISAQISLAAGWPMVRGNAARSGYTSEALPENLSIDWTYQANHVPQSAWPRDDRMQFDRAYHVVVANGTLFFGSSVDGKVYALDAATGAGKKWTFFTEGPVRFAPVVWKDRLFVGSDDGYLYCLSTADGSLIRTMRGGPNSDRVLGNGHIISRRPIRGGPVILDDVLYFAAGIWQSEGIYLYAINPGSGEILWTNDSSGGIYMPQPHGGASAKSGVSAQGYLVAAGKHLFVPTGRAVPAAFNRADGTFKYYHLQANTHRGGTPTAAFGQFVYNGGYAYEAETGALRTTIGEGAIAEYPGGVISGSSSGLQAFKPIEKETKDRKGNPITFPDHIADWKIDGVSGGVSLIVAGETIVSGGTNAVSLVDLKSKKPIKTFKIDGLPYGLAAAEGRLFVSTDKGTIICFAVGKNTKPDVIANVFKDSPYGENARFAAAADEIIKTTQITQGYCVDLGCGDGALAYELAKRTQLTIVAIDSDPKNVERARKNLDAAGLYGSRVSVHLGDPSKSGYPKYFANLVVSGRSVLQGTVSLAKDKEVARLQRPYGGVRCLGKPGDMQSSVRGALAKAGSWSHLYSNPANTLSSQDEIKGPLRVLWFRDVDLELPQRHGRGPSPLVYEGRIFAEGMDELRAVDAYNGRTLWRFKQPGVLHAYNGDHIMGTSGTGSNFCAAGDSVYLRNGSYCYRLDTATGNVLGTFEAPKHRDGQPGRWGYIACEDGVLYGSVVNEKHIVTHAWRRADDLMKQQFTESMYLFAMDAKTGTLLWRYDAKQSIRHNAIAIGDGRVFLIDRALAVDDLLSNAPARRGEKGPPKVGHPTGELVVLNAKTGKEMWTNDEDIYGTMLVFSEKFDMLLMSYQSTRFKIPSELGGRMAVFRATDGYRVWDKEINYVTRPLVNDRTIFAQGGSWDLLTGEDQPFDFKRSYGCGQIAASKHLLLFRSATLGYKDLTRSAGTENFGGVRPGCWINTLPAGGLVLLPDASAGCRCSYQNRSWVALQGAD